MYILKLRDRKDIGFAHAEKIYVVSVQVKTVLRSIFNHYLPSDKFLRENVLALARLIGAVPLSETIICSVYPNICYNLVNIHQITDSIQDKVRDSV